MNRQKSRRLGCASFLAKPVDEKELYAALKEFLALNLDQKIDVAIYAQNFGSRNCF